LAQFLSGGLRVLFPAPPSVLGAPPKFKKISNLSFSKLLYYP